MKLKSIALLAIVATLVAAPAMAQATRTWVSGVGDDVNPCSRTAPCKTFAGAIAKTAAGGEISVLDPGGFGAVTIAKSISIVGESSAEAGILAPGTNGITVNAGPGDIVNLRGLVIEGGVSGANGVRFQGGGSLTIENSLIRNFRGPGGGNGVLFTPSGASNLTIVSSTIADNSGAAIVVAPALSGRAIVALDQVRLIDNGLGLTATGAGAQVWIGDSTIAGSTTAVQAAGGAVIRSFGDNALAGNGADGTPMTSTPRH
jgi:hypothetical protein